MDMKNLSSMNNQRFVQENYGGTKISMAVNRKPGEKMYIDWVGDQPGLLTDESSYLCHNIRCEQYDLCRGISK